MNIKIYQQNPLTNFTKFGLKHQNPQFMHSPKITLQCMKKLHVKQKINEKERV